MNTETNTNIHAKRAKLKKQSNALEVFMRLSKNKAAMVGLIIFVLEIVLAIAAPLYIPYDVEAIDFTVKNQGPSLQHLLGTDNFGRDIFSRLMVGARYSIGLGVVSMIFAVVAGVFIGSIAGYFGGVVDNTIMRILDVFQSLPGMLLAIVLSTTLGTGFINTMLALSIGWIPGMARLIRGSILNIRKMEYLEAAESINCGKLRTIVSHVLPNSISPVIVTATMGVPTIIMSAAALSFIGLGIQPPTPEWGAMLTAARGFVRDYPYMVISPGLAIAITVLALNMLGDGLRDAMDPKLKD